jgi:hypothetical protein
MSDITKLTQEKLLKRFKEYSTHQVDSEGYVYLPEHNLTPGITIDQFRDDLRQGSGEELRKKFLAIHSSSALAVNTFARWKKNPHTLSLCGVHGFNNIQFEQKCPTGLGGTPPNLDLLAESDEVVIGIESKFLEYFTPKKPTFSESYQRNCFPHAEDKWWSLLEEMRKIEPLNLDTAQLIKHYLGLINQPDYRNLKIILLYLFWEPGNWNEFDVFKRHREEINMFNERVKDTSVKFVAQSYPELWKEWESEKGLADHLRYLRERYYVNL